jgi:hypothetical protein
MPRIATLIGGLLLSRGGRQMMGRNAGKLALAGLAWQLFQASRRARNPAKATPRHTPRPAARARWSDRRPS